MLLADLLRMASVPTNLHLFYFMWKDSFYKCCQRGLFHTPKQAAVLWTTLWSSRQITLKQTMESKLSFSLFLEYLVFNSWHFKRNLLCLFSVLFFWIRLKYIISNISNISSTLVSELNSRWRMTEMYLIAINQYCPVANQTEKTGQVCLSKTCMLHSL